MRPLFWCAAAWMAGGCANEPSATRGWTRVFPEARFVTAPVAVGDDVILAVTTLESGAVLDNFGEPVAFVAGNARRATCTVIRVDASGAVAWQSPVVALGGQTLCTRVANEVDAIVVEGEAFDVDAPFTLVTSGGASAYVNDGFALSISSDGIVDDVRATAAPIHVFPEATRVLDVDGRVLEAPASSGYLQESGSVVVDGDRLAALLVPQRTELAVLVDGARPAPEVGGVDESIVVIARVER